MKRLRLLTNDSELGGKSCWTDYEYMSPVGNHRMNVDMLASEVKLTIVQKVIGDA